MTTLPQLRRSQQGVVILTFVTIILLGITTLLVTQLSVNQRLIKQNQGNLESLRVAKQALLGHALQAAIPGTLPCPDTTGDGLENLQGANCQAQLGLLPHRTLNLPELSDGSGAELWYAVDLNYVANAGALKNSSIATTLSLDGVPVASVIISPGKPLDGQARRLLNQQDFLEGENADGNLNSYGSTQSQTQNDQILAIEPGSFWSLVETRVIATTAELLNNYRLQCGEYPWAATFGGPFNSVVSEQSGSPPFASALPNDWGSACGFGSAPIPPAWLTVHWSNQLLYQMCEVAEGNCTTIFGSNNSPAAGVIIAPGVPLPGQVRPNIDLEDYFEDENSSFPVDQFRQHPTIDHDTTYNDRTQSLTP